MSILDKNYIVTMPDESKWAVPVRIIAENRAKYYAGVDEISFEESLITDTVPLFESDDYEIHDWAANNMNWRDVKEHAIQLERPNLDYEYGWANADYEVKAKSKEE